MKAALSAAVLLSATLLAGCGGGTSNPTGNPITTSVTVTQGGTPVGAGIAVTLSTAISGTPSAPTGILQTLNTNSGGIVTFSNLPGGQLCVSTTVSAAFYYKCGSPISDTNTLGT